MKMKHPLIYFLINLIFIIHNVYSTVSISAKYDDDLKQSVKLTAKHSLQLNCNITTDDNDDDIKVLWKKDGKFINDIKNLETRNTQTQKGTIYTLKITSTTDEDTGIYQCQAYDKDNDDKLIKSAEINVASQIAVRVPGNINVVEGEKLRIHCTVFGKPYPKLHWSYYNETINTTMYYESKDRIKLEKDVEKDIDNAILIIEQIEMYDRGTYTCYGESELSGETVSHSSMIRIKDKYAALWPFLGICAEVFILCAIILIYEKKRNKSELEESDTDQSPDQKNTPDHSKDSNLRHRQ